MSYAHIHGERDLGPTQWEKAEKWTGITLAVIIAIHVILFLSVLLSGNWDRVIGETPILAVAIWIILNDFAALFALAFANACFSGGSLFKKIIGYPFGAVIMLMISSFALKEMPINIKNL